MLVVSKIIQYFSNIIKAKLFISIHLPSGYFISKFVVYNSVTKNLELERKYGW